MQRFDKSEYSTRRRHPSDREGNARERSPAFPNLSNQWSRYLNQQLRAYRSGKRDNAIMNAQAAALTDGEIRILADHYGTRP